MKTSESKRVTRVVEFIPTRMGTRRVLLRLNTRPGSRCVLGRNGIVAMAPTGSEVRLLCVRHWRLYHRMQYRIAPATRRGNISHTPGVDGWIFREVFVAEDRRVQIGWEVNGSRRRPVVRLSPKVRTRVRLRGAVATWWPSIAEVDALARCYGRPIPPAGTTLRAMHEGLARMKGDLRSLLERRHPELARRRSIADSGNETLVSNSPGATSND
jgi:hypothetical protein